LGSNVAHPAVALARDTLDALRRYSEVPDEVPCGVAGDDVGRVKYTHAWEYVVPGVTYEFRGLPGVEIYSKTPSGGRGTHPVRCFRLDVRVTPHSRNPKGDLLPIAWCKDHVEAERAIALYMRGVDPSDAHREGAG
jgi:hypothetical protein